MLVWAGISMCLPPDHGKGLIAGEIGSSRENRHRFFTYRKGKRSIWKVKCVCVCVCVFSWVGETDRRLLLCWAVKEEQTAGNVNSDPPPPLHRSTPSSLHPSLLLPSLSFNLSIAFYPSLTIFLPFPPSLFLLLRLPPSMSFTLSLHPPLCSSLSLSIPLCFDSFLLHCPTISPTLLSLSLSLSLQPSLFLWGLSCKAPVFFL